MEKKNNHIIPKALLKQWKTFNQNRYGVYCYEIESKSSFFSASDGKRGYSFAIEEDFYVPRIENERKLNVEDWFCGLEHTLAITIERLNKGTESPICRNREDFTKFSMALLSLKHRTKYHVEQVIKYLNNNPATKKLVEASENRSVRLVSLENIVNAITEESIEYANYEMLVCRNLTGNLIIGDQPFMADVVDGYNFVTLSPYYFVAFRKSRNSTFTYIPSEDGMIDTLNRYMAKATRYWIVAKNEEILAKYIEEASQTKDELTPDFQSIKYIRRGYTIE